MKYLLIIFLIHSCTFKKNDTNTNITKSNDSIIVTEQNVKQDYMLTAFEEMMKTTSFTALIQQYKIESFPIEDLDKNDDFAEKRVLFYANVIKTFKGNHQDKIIYEMIMDIDEDETLNKEPILICLCKKDKTFYWPGTGSIFPNKQFLINKANEIKKIGVYDKKNSNCLDE